METIDDTIATADREWRRYGVRRPDRQALAADLRTDLESASADGVTPAQLLGPDVRGFARQLADEAGVRTVPPAYSKVVATTLTGSVLGAVAGYLLFQLLFAAGVRLVDMPASWNVPVQLEVGVYYGVPALAVVACAIAAVRIHLSDLPHVRATIRAMWLLLPLAGIVITPITMAYAWTTGYSTMPQVVLMEAVMVLAALGGAAALARRWAVREPAADAEVSLV